MQKSFKQKGFTIMELLIVVGLVGLLVMVIVPRLKAGSDASTAQVILDDVTTIFGAGKKWKGIKVSYAGITFVQLTNSGLLRADWADGTAANPRGGNYTVASAGAGNQLTVTATGLTAELCNSILHSMEGGVAAAQCNGTTLSITQ